MTAMTRTGTTLLALLLSALCGASQAASMAGPAGSNVSAPAPATDAADDDDKVVSNLDCGKVFSADDFAGILQGKITISVNSMRDNACHFESADGPTINLYSGDGFTDQLEWKQAVANRNGEYKPLAGVGDQAFYRNGELFSRKGGYYCAISGNGRHPPSDALATKLGALCNKVFAAR